MRNQLIEQPFVGHPPACLHLLYAEAEVKYIYTLLSSILKEVEQQNIELFFLTSPRVQTTSKPKIWGRTRTTGSERGAASISIGSCRFSPPNLPAVGTSTASPPASFDAPLVSDQINRLRNQQAQPAQASTSTSGSTAPP